MSGRDTEVSKMKMILEYDSKSALKDGIEETESLGKFRLSVSYLGGKMVKSYEKTFLSLKDYDHILSQYYKSVWTRLSFILLIFFIIWLILHLIFLTLQIKFNIIKIGYLRRELPIELNQDSEIVTTTMNNDLRNF